MSPRLISLPTLSPELQSLDFWRQRCAREFTNLTFRCSDGAVVEAHACYFSTFSDILISEKQGFDGGLAIVLPDFPSGAVEALLQLLYLGSTSALSSSDIAQVAELLGTLVIRKTAYDIVCVPANREEETRVACTKVDLEGNNRDEGYFTPSPTLEPDYVTSMDEFISDFDNMPELFNDPWFMPAINEELRSVTLEVHQDNVLDCDGLAGDFIQCTSLQIESRESQFITLPQLSPKIRRVGTKDIVGGVEGFGIAVPTMPKKRGRKRKHEVVVPGERSAHSCPTCDLPLGNAEALRTHLALVHHRAALTRTFTDCKYFEHCLRCNLILADTDAMVTHTAFVHRDRLDRLLNPWEFASLYNITLESMIAMPKVLLAKYDKYDERQSKRFRPMQVTKKDDDGGGGGGGGGFLPHRCFVCGLVSQDLSSLQEHLAVGHFLSSLRERCGARPAEHLEHCPICLKAVASDGRWATHVAFAHGKIRDVVLSEEHVQQAIGVARRK